MNDIDPDKKQNVICHCSGTTKEQIKELVNNGIDNLDGISRMTGACSGCGACDVLILELLAENRVDCGVYPGSSPFSTGIRKSIVPTSECGNDVTQSLNTPTAPA